MGLPRLVDGKAPPGLKDYGPMVEEADGFAQVRPGLPSPETPSRWLAQSAGNGTIRNDRPDLCTPVGQVFPEHKYLIVECLRQNGYKVRGWDH